MNMQVTNERVFEICCNECGKPFFAKGANAIFCDDCKKERKIQLDHEAWERRKRKEGPLTRRERRDMIIERLERQHAAMLGIDPWYYDVWKEKKKDAYKKWMIANLPKDVVPGGSRKRVYCDERYKMPVGMARKVTKII